MPLYLLECDECKKQFDEICNFTDFDNGFINVCCPYCNCCKVNKLLDGTPAVMFGNPKESSKWDNWYYRQGFTADQAKKERMAAEKAAGGKSAYKHIDDTDGGRRMNFIK